MSRRTNKLVIITYHRIIPEHLRHDADEIDVGQFRMHADVFAKYFNVLKLSDAVTRMKEGALPYRAIALTFDDGYRDNVSEALPILANSGIPATFFVASSFLDGGIMWNDIVIESVRRCGEDHLDLEDIGLGSMDTGSTAEKRSAIRRLLSELKYRPQSQRDSLCSSIANRLGVSPPTDLMMNSSDLIVLRDAGMEIGGHTRTHPILTTVPDDVADAEIKRGKRDLEEILGDEVVSFAYPNGRPGQDYDRRHVSMVRRAGFKQAVTTSAGCANRNSDRYQLGRLSVWHRTRPRLLLRMLLNYFSDEAAIA